MDYVIRVCGTAALVVVIVLGGMWLWERMHLEPVTEPVESAPVVEKTEPKTQTEEVTPDPVVQEASVAPETGPEAPSEESSKAEPEDEPKRSLKGNGVITGVVVNEIDKQPVAGATVTVAANDRQTFGLPSEEICRKTATTASDGTFTITGLPVKTEPLTFGVHAIKGDLSGLDLQGVRITRTRPKAEVLLSLLPHNTVTGTVRTQDGTPIENATISVNKMGGNPLPLDPAVLAAGHSLSDANGHFTLTHHAPLPIGLRVVAANYPAKDVGPLDINAKDVEVVMEPGMTVAGQVLVKGTGNPVPEGSVYLFSLDSSSRYVTQTDTQGQFNFSVVGPGQYHLYLSHDHYVLDEQEAMISVSQGTDVTDLTLYATEGATISGRIYDEDTNEGIVGASIRLRVPFTENIATTDDEGYYSQPGIPGGSVTVTPIEAKGYPSPDWRMRRELTVTPGQSIENIDFAFRKGLCISGIVLDPEGKPVPNTRVTAHPSDGGDYRSASSDENGRFEILGLLPATGLYAYAEVEGYGCPPAGPFDLIDESVSDITIQLTEASTIEGVVVDPNGNPVPNAGVWAQKPNANNGTTTEANAQGQFTLSNLYAGKYILYPNRSARGGFYLDQPHPVEVAEGEHLTGVELTLINVGGLSISGRITNMDGLAVSWASIDVRGPGGSYVRGTQSEQDGHYSVEGLSEGDYTLTASSSSCYRSEPVVATAGSENVDFVLPQAGCVQGQVVDARTSQPIQQFEVYGTQGHRHFETWMQDNFSQNADAEGRFSYSRISEPQYTLFFRAPGYATMAVPFSDVGPGETLDGVIVRLEPSSPIEGVVQTDRGEPVSGARIFIGDVPDSYRRNYGEVAVSRADGSFTIDSLPVDTITVSACHPAHAPGSGTISPNGSVTIVLTEGGVIQGCITQGGKPIGGLEVQAYCRNSTGSNSTQGNVNTDTNGMYMMTGLQPAETYRVYAYLRDERRSRSQDNVVVAAGMTTEVNFDFPRADASIEGRVTIDGQPPGGNRQGYVSAETFANGEQERASAQIGIDGYYRIEAIPAGVVSIQAYAYDQEGQYCRRLLETETYSGRTTLLDIELNGGARITGQVTNLPSGWTASVMAFSGSISIPDNLMPFDFESVFGQNPPISSTQISGDGSFTLRGLEPGTITVLVFAGDPAIDQLARNGMPDEETIRKMIRSASTVVDVPAEGETTVNVSL